MAKTKSTPNPDKAGFLFRAFTAAQKDSKIKESRLCITCDTNYRARRGSS